MASGGAFTFTRVTGEKTGVPREALIGGIASRLQAIQNALLTRAKDFRAANTKIIASKEDFYTFFDGEDAGGFALAHWSGDMAVAEQVKNDLKVTVRCTPCDGELAKLGAEEGAGTCVFTGQPSERLVVWSKAY